MGETPILRERNLILEWAKILYLIGEIPFLSWLNNLGLRP